MGKNTHIKGQFIQRVHHSFHLLVLVLIIIIFSSTATSATIESFVEHCTEIATIECLRSTGGGGCSTQNCRFLNKNHIRTLEVVFACDWGQTDYLKPFWIVKEMVEPWCTQGAPIAKRAEGSKFSVDEDITFGIDDQEIQLMIIECPKDERIRLCKVFSKRLLQCLSTPRDN